jgi:hypothetical protein
MFNSKEYSFSNVSVNLLGRTINGCLGVKYGVKNDKSYLYGRGSDPYSIQPGVKSYEGELTVTQSEINAMVDAVKAADPTADLTDISFDVVIAYGEGNKVNTDVLVSAEFIDYEKGMKTGDKNMEVTLKIMALKLRENV